MGDPGQTSEKPVEGGGTAFEGPGRSKHTVPKLLTTRRRRAANMYHTIVPTHGVVRKVTCFRVSTASTSCGDPRARLYRTTVSNGSLGRVVASRARVASRVVQSGRAITTVGPDWWASS